MKKKKKKLTNKKQNKIVFQEHDDSLIQVTCNEV